MDWSLLHTLNDFMASHDGLEDSLLFYVEASEALHRHPGGRIRNSLPPHR
jgi:hypothetical protein